MVMVRSEQGVIQPQDPWCLLRKVKLQALFDWMQEFAHKKEDKKTMDLGNISVTSSLLLHYCRNVCPTWVRFS